MMMQDLNRYIKKGSLVIFNATAIVACLGYLLDITNFKTSYKIIIFINSFSIVFTFIPLILYHLKLLNLRISFSIIIYTFIANILVDTYSDLDMIYRIEMFLRDSLFVLLILTLAALTLHKIHALIITSVYVVNSITFSTIIDNEFLDSSIPLILFIISAYSGVIYYFVDVLEKAILDREKKQSIIINQNKLLNETNTKLEKRQQLVEEQAKELRLQRDKLKEYNATKDKLFSILAHDLKSPFNPLLGYIDLLKESDNDLTNKELQQIITIIHESGHKIYKLLEDLLQWSISQRGGMPFFPVKTNLKEIVQKVFSLLQDAIEKKDHTISYSLQPNDIILEVDTDMLYTILRNLIFNAIKFTPRGGNIKLDSYIENNMVIVKVYDNGIGMNKETLKRIFEISTVKSKKGTDYEKGTGLGLIVTHEFVVKHGGDIKVDSKPGKGSVFTIQLPQFQNNEII